MLFQSVPLAVKFMLFHEVSAHLGSVNGCWEIALKALFKAMRTRVINCFIVKVMPSMWILVLRCIAEAYSAFSYLPDKLCI